MKSKDLIDFESEINYSEDIDRLMHMAMIIFDKMRIVELRDEIEKLENRMYEGTRADYCFDVPPFEDDEIHLAATVIKGRLRVLGEKVPEEEKDEEPKEI
jgi:hypothetical protein